MTLHPLVFEQHPLVALLVAWGLAWLLTPRPLRVDRALWLTLAALVVLVFAATSIWYAQQSTYFDPAEPTITAVAAMFRDGRPLYPALDAPEKYVHIYGPALFMAQAMALTIFGATITVSKAVGVVAALAALAIGYWTFARRTGPASALLATAGWALVSLTTGNTAFWTRPDPLLALVVVVGLASVETRRRAPAALILGAALGIAVNLKANGPICFLPVAVLFGERHGFKALCGAAATAAAVAIAPFALPTVSLTHYISYLQMSAHNGLMAARLRQNLEWAAFLLLPCVAAAHWRQSGVRSVPVTGADRWFTPALITSVLSIAVIGAKPGGGAFHLLPLAPVLILAMALRSGPWPRALRSLVLAAAITTAVIAIPRQLRFIDAIERRPSTALIADVQAFAAAHPTPAIAAGYAGISTLSQASAVLALTSHDYWLDGPAVQEYRLSGMDLPAATLAAIDSCRTQYWLLPRDTPPFVVTSAYAPLAPADVFWPAFRAAFLRRYERTGNTGSFDVWTCRPVR